MESFIRSKYESKRWARDGPLPSDPSVLANGADPPIPQQQAVPSNTSTSRPTHASSASLSGRSTITTRQPQAHQLLSTNFPTTQRQPTATATAIPPAPAAAPVPPPAQPKAPENDLFSLDFHAPPVPVAPTPEAPKKDVKQEILSLFSTAPAISAPAYGQFGGVPAGASPWGNVQPQQQQQYQQPTSMLGNNGIGAWGTASGWTGASIAQPPMQTNLWGNPAPASTMQQPVSAGLFNTTDMWSSAAPAAAPSQDLFGTSLGSGGGGSLGTQKKDDAFGDLWGGFK